MNYYTTNPRSNLAPGDQAGARPNLSPAPVGVALRRAHRGSSDVEMRPMRLADEALQQLRGGDRAAEAAAGILHVGELGIDHLVVFGPKWHPPDPLAGSL